MRTAGPALLQSFGQTMPRILGFAGLDAHSMAGRLHDASAEIALGLGLLRPKQPGLSSRGRQAVAMLDQALGDLKQLEADVRRETSPRPPRDLVPELQRQAAFLGLALDLRVAGTSEEVAPCFLDLLELVGREALMNVRRHSGARSCEIDLDFTVVPFVLRARDRGVGPGSRSEAGRGLSTLRALARWLGCELRIASPPGFGTELILIGPQRVVLLGDAATEPSPQEVASS